MLVMMIVIMAVMLVIVLTMIVFVIMLTMIMFVIVRVEMIVLVFVLDEGRQLIAGRRLAGDLQLILEGVPDALELGLDQPLRQIELVDLVERIEDIALELHCRHLGEFPSDALADGLPELGDVFEANLLGELVVEDGLLGA